MCVQVDFIEHFDVTEDPWHMHNLYNNSAQGAAGAGANPEVVALHTELHKWFGCSGDACP
eukprot:COSAG05_NODE_2077_length_3603_cov_18.751712_5_plen_60_part_00